MEERWGFLLPWCKALKGRISYLLPDEEGVTWATRGRYLWVILPERGRLDEEDYELTPEDEVKFQREFQNVQEALALLSVVAHVDYTAWRYLLETHCGLYSASLGRDLSQFGQKEEARYGNVITPRFLLRIRVKAIKSTGSGSFNSDLVQFCGVNWHDNPSHEYLDALSRIAALDPNFTAGSPGVDVKVPVRVGWHGSTHLLKDIRQAEQTIRDQWGERGKNLLVPPGSLRCTFELEPTEANVYIKSPETVELLDALITRNVRFSQFCLQLWMDYQLEYDDKPAAKKLFAKLTTRVFDNVRRPVDETSYTFDNNSIVEDIPRLQLGAVHVDCRNCTSSRFEAFCSAMVMNQTTAKLSIKLKIKPKFRPAKPVRTRRWWKWIAYALFSKRARACSALKSLALMRIGSMSVEDMEGFAAVVKSDHPEEELFDRPRGLIKPRDATLKRGAPIRWKFDSEGEPNLDWDPITFDAAIPFVRTFSDDGASAWVDTIIPGLGRCQVQRDDLDFQPATKDYTGDSSGGVTSLQIGFAEEDGDLWEGLPMFLATVGSSLTFLGLDYHKGGLEDILQNCPNLQELAFSGGFTVFRLNFGDYDGGADQFDYDWRDIEALAQALSDNDNPLAKCLRRLRVRFHWLWAHEHVDDPKVYNPRIKTDVEALLKMLQVNRSLEFLDVHLPPPYHDCADSLREYHLKPISRPSQELATESKLALLSVILARYQTPELNKDKPECASPRCAQNLLDEYVVSSIFELAAPPVVRQVYVRRVFEKSWLAQEEEEII